MPNVTKKNLIIIKSITVWKWNHLFTKKFFRKKKINCSGFMPGDFKVIRGSMVSKNRRSPASTETPEYIAMPSKWKTINFELIRLINRTCNFRTEVYTEPYETFKMELFAKIVNGFKLLIIFTKKLHLDKVCRSSHLRCVLENRCSEICSQSTWKVPMKKFIFRLTVCNFQSRSLRFLPNEEKKFVKTIFRRFLS